METAVSGCEKKLLLIISFQ